MINMKIYCYQNNFKIDTLNLPNALKWMEKYTDWTELNYFLLCYFICVLENIDGNLTLYKLMMSSNHTHTYHQILVFIRKSLVLKIYEWINFMIQISPRDWNIFTPKQKISRLKIISIKSFQNSPLWNIPKS